MKKVLLIAAIFLAAASVAQAQMPRGTVSRQSQANVNVESCIKKTQNGIAVSRPSNNTMGCVAKPAGQGQLPKVTNPVKVTDPNKPYLHETWKQNTPNALYQSHFQSWANYHFDDVYEKMMWAQERRIDAHKALLELTEKQKLEKAKLQELFNKSMPEGQTSEQWMIDEMLKLEQKHAKQLAKAKEKCDKADRRYNEAVKKVQDARLEISRLEMVRFT